MIDPVSLGVLGIIAYRAISCVGVGLGDLAKAKAMKSLIDRGKKEITVKTPDGRMVTFYIDEFVGEDGETQVEISLKDHADGNVYVLTVAEVEIFAKADFVEKLVDSEVEMSSNGWRSVIRPLLGSVRRREKEVRKSPGRRGRRR